MEEQLFEAIGSYGPWQKWIFAIFFYTNMVAIWQNYAMTFFAPNVPFRCSSADVCASDNQQQHLEGLEWDGQCYFHPCNSTREDELLPCTEWEYDIGNYSDTLVSEWDLVCNREWLISFGKSVYMIGFLLSVFVSGQLADRFGRYPVILVFYLITVLGLGLSLFSTSITAFLIFRFIQAFGRTGFTITEYVLMMEIVGPKVRTNVGIGVQLGFSCGLVTLAFIGYFFQHWFWFQVAIAVPFLPLAIAFLYIPESPRWLLMQGKVDRLEKLMMIAAKNNGKDPKGNAIKQLLKAKVTEQKGTLLDLFRTPKMRCRTINMMYLWIVNSFLYYALSFNTNDMSGNRYLNFLLVGLLEFPAYGMLYFCILRFGRRIVMVLLMVAGGAACLAVVAVPSGLTWLEMTFAQAGKFFVTASFTLLYLYTGEMFPTVVRSAALGSCSTVARIGSIVAPFSKELGKASHPSVPNILCCLLAVSSGLFALWLPETRGRQMPDTLEEGEDLEMKA